MKKIFLLIILNFSFVLNAQTIIKGNYIFNVNSSVYKNNRQVDDNNGIKEGYKIVVDSVEASTVYYKYWSFKDEKSDEGKSLNNKMFSMPKNDFKKITTKYYSFFKGFSAGGFAVPIRLRGKGSTFTFDNELSLGANLLCGIGHHSSPYSYVDLSIGLSITKLNLTKDNSRNLTDSRSASALTFSVGGIAKLDKLFYNIMENKNPINVGVFVGFDSLGATDRTVDWIYNKKIWIGLGLNIGINPVASNDGASGNNNSKK